MREPNRVLIVGSGSAGRRHSILAGEMLQEAEVRSVSSREMAQPSRARSVIGAFRPELAVLANPAPGHVPLAVSLAECGVNLLIEKPLSDGVAGVSELISVAEEAGIVAMVGYNLRFFQSLRTFRELVVSGYVGRVLSVRCEVGQYLPSWRPDADYRHSVSARSDLGGGALLELSHELDYLRWILGGFEWVQARVARTSALEIDVEDQAHLTLSVAVPDGDPEVLASVSMDLVRRDTTRTCTVIGSGGSLRWDATTNSVEVFRPENRGWESLAGFSDEAQLSYRAEWAALIESVRTGSPPPISLADGLSVVQLVVAAKESSDSGRRVSLI